MSTSFKPYSTMKQVAALAGEPESDHPKTACPVATRIILYMELQMDRGQQARLNEAVVPMLKDSRNPRRTSQRLTYLVEKAVRTYAQESLKENGAQAGAAAVRDEPNRRRAAELARGFAANLKAEIPRMMRTQSEGRKLAAARAAENAANAAKALSSDDTTLQMNAAQATALAMIQWGMATKHDPVVEAISLLGDMLSIK